jgi:NF-kappa-B inhibitor-interacting Ras-like protein
MGKTYKIIVCGKKTTGKTTILEQLIYNNANITSNNQSTSNNVNTTQTSSSGVGHRPSTSSLSSTISSNSLTNNTVVSSNDKYFSTIEDIYVACWEKDKGIKEKLRFYDTKGMENSKDTDTINQMRHLFPIVDGAVLLFTSSDPDSIQCIEKLKSEIEKSKDKKEICHFIMLDNTMPIPLNLNNPNETTNSNKELIRQDLQARLRSSVYELSTLDKRDLLCKPFIDLAVNITQVNTKGSMNLVQSIKKPKVFSSNK